MKTKAEYRSPGQYSRDITKLLSFYEGDPEAAHEWEDELLWRYVRWQAEQGDPTARRLLRLDNATRTRWYA